MQCTQLLRSRDELHKSSRGVQRLRQMWLLWEIKDVDSPVVACPCTHPGSWTWLQVEGAVQPALCLLVQTERESCIYDHQHQSSSYTAHLHPCLALIFWRAACVMSSPKG